MNKLQKKILKIFRVSIHHCCHCSVMSDSLWPHGLQHTRLPCPSQSPRPCSNLYPLSQWYHPTISFFVVPFSCFPSFPASGSFPMNWFLTSGNQRIGTSASVSVLPMNIQDWFPLGFTGWISLYSKGLSRVFNTTVQKLQFFNAQPSLWFNSQIHTWLLENTWKFSCHVLVKTSLKNFEHHFASVWNKCNCAVVRTYSP